MNRADAFANAGAEAPGHRLSATAAAHSATLRTCCDDAPSIAADTAAAVAAAAAIASEPPWVEIDASRALSTSALEVIRRSEDADRCNTNGRATAIVLSGDAGRITGVVKLPERLHAGMHALPTREHLAPDRLM